MGALQDAQKAKRKKINQILAYELEPSDWTVIRLAEKGTGIPAQIATSRNQVRQEASQAKTAVTDATTVEEVDAVDLQPLIDKTLTLTGDVDAENES